MNNSADKLPLDAEIPPLRVDPGGIVRVSNTRISLDLIVEQYGNGMTPEDMVRAYDSLLLAGATVARRELHPLTNDTISRRTDTQINSRGFVVLESTRSMGVSPSSSRSSEAGLAR